MSIASSVDPTGLTWTPAGDYEWGVLTVSSPDGIVYRDEFGIADTLSFGLVDQGGILLRDGSYSYELRLFRTATRAEWEAQGRPAGVTDRNALVAARRMGHLTILGGRLAVGDEDATAGGPPSLGGDVPGLRDMVFLDDLIVDGSACIGLDCVNGESFGFDTLRLKENNLRIEWHCRLCNKDLQRFLLQ